jgi:hypothetical protein
MVKNKILFLFLFPPPPEKILEKIREPNNKKSLASRAGHRNWPTKHLRLSKPTNMTIHWKALKEHFLVVPLFFRFNH